MRQFTIHILIALLFCGTANAQSSMERIVDLTGDWKFEIGDNPDRAAADFDDASWDEIHVPDFWENQGYPGYDGWAWYRTTFVLSADRRNDALFLYLGTIDDVDEVYLNGRFIGFQGLPPPHYITAYADRRWYYMPTEYLHFDDENVIAVRVYDNEMGGGIVQGSIGVYRDRSYLIPDQSLRGPWKLRTGDDMERARVSYDDSGWNSVLVPLPWETQGLKGYDGFAWYRKDFVINPALRDQRLVLLLGKIDDVDEVWVNGRRIGKTGDMPMEGGTFFDNASFQQLRAYYVPREALNLSGGNVIAVRVYDGFMHGGIYQGPVGLVRQDRYRAWAKENAGEKGKGMKGLFEWFFGD